MRDRSGLPIIATVVLLCACGSPSAPSSAPVLGAGEGAAAFVESGDAARSTDDPAALAACLNGSSSASCSFASGASERPRSADALAFFPAAPSIGRSGVEGNVIVLGWSPVVTDSSGRPLNRADAVTHYVIDARSSKGGSNLLPNYRTGRNQTTFQAKVSPGIYYFRIRAVNRAGPGAPSREEELIVKCFPPHAPSNLRVVTNSDGIVTLAWSPAVGAPTGYVIGANSTSGLRNPFDGAEVASTTFSTRDVPPGTYSARVRAKNACGTGDPSNEIKFIVRSTNPSYDGLYRGTYTGDFGGPLSGLVAFSVYRGTITVTAPGPGTGTVSGTGSASFGGSGSQAGVRCQFTGMFHVSGDAASGRGNWTCTYKGSSGTGTWTARRF